MVLIITNPWIKILIPFSTILIFGSGITQFVNIKDQTGGGVKDLKYENVKLKKKIENLTLDSLRQRNSYQGEIANLQKE